MWVSTWFGMPWVCDSNTVYLSAAYGYVFVDDGADHFLAAQVGTSTYLPRTGTSRFLVGWTPPYAVVPESFWGRMRVARWWIQFENIGP